MKLSPVMIKHALFGQIGQNGLNAQPHVEEALGTILFYLLKFIYSEKATNFCEISTADLSYVVTVKWVIWLKSMVEISPNFLAFSEYMNFI